MKLVISLLCAQLLLSQFSNSVAHAASTETKTFEANSIKRIEIDNTTGLVKINGTDAAKATVIIEKVRFGDHCVLKLDQVGSKLVMDIERKNLGIGVECKVNVTFNIPKAAELEVGSSSGNIEINGVTRAVDVSTRSGDINIEAQLEKLNAKTGSGYISLKGSVIDADIKSGSGEVTLTYTTAPQPGEIEIKTGSGSAFINLPGVTEINASTITASGSIQNEFPGNKNAKYKVSFRSGSGNISIKKSDSNLTN
ncbi:MAG: DUF4097 family beta strand repeat protein [Bdellovibrionaceae bacterium]|nr:DUF4097 family beta strand repeat protein [Bdellovibrio sp.]